jgi:hypothetical protein
MINSKFSRVAGNGGAATETNRDSHGPAQRAGAQIKVSAQFEMSKAAPKVVANSQ